MTRKWMTGFCIALSLLSLATAAPAEEKIRLLIMASDDPKTEGPRYELLTQYLAVTAKLPAFDLRVAKNYPEAVQLYQAGEAEAMISDSFAAAVLLKKDLARAVARPVLANGLSTSRTLVLAKAGTKPFTGLADLKGKRVAYCMLASSGEIFVRTLLSAGQKPDDVFSALPANSHQVALNALESDAADYAVVKSTLWDPDRHKTLAVVATESGEFPSNTLIMPPSAYAKWGDEIRKALLKIEDDTSPLAQQVKQAFGCKAFTAGGPDDFAATFHLIEKARLDPKTFTFTF